MKTTRIARAAALLLMVTTITLILPSTLCAEVPQVINYQGRVAVGGVNFDGVGQFKFALVNGDGSVVYWSNSPDTTPADAVPDAAVTLTVTKGLYSVLLGDTSLGANMTAIPNAVFTNPDVRLRVWFDDGSNGSQLLTPDQRIVAVGYAMAAGVADTAVLATNATNAVTATTATTVSDAAITTGKISDGNITAAKLAPGAANDADADPTNEIQILGLTGNTLSLSGGGGFVDGSGFGPWTLAGSDISFAGGGVFATGILGSGGMPIENGVSATDVRLVWAPGKAAFRAGGVNTTDWDTVNVGDYSTALGRNTEASGTYTFAVGSNSTASGTNAIAMGNNTIASGTYSTAMGFNTVASGIGSFAEGWSSIASGIYSIAMGDTATASGNYSIAMGDTATASGDNSIAMGNNAYTTASARRSFAVGANSTVTGAEGTAIGYNATAGAGAVAMGDSTTASGTNATALGRDTTASGTGSFAAGRFATASHNGSFVWGDGTEATVSTANNGFVVRAHGGARFYTAPGTATGVTLAASGTAWASLSDRNAKKNFSAVDSEAVLDRLAGIPVQRWNYKHEADDAVAHIGPVAQDFIGAFYPGRDDKRITTLEFDGVALAAIQGLNAKVERENAKLERENEALRERLGRLERAMEALTQGRSGAEDSGATDRGSETDGGELTDR